MKGGRLGESGAFKMKEGLFCPRLSWTFPRAAPPFPLLYLRFLLLSYSVGIQLS